MKKKLIALTTALCLAIAPMSILAEETEGTDYSYLEDMSVKELKELRDAINKILGDDGGTTEEDIAAKHPEWDELDAESDPYATAIILAEAVKESLYDRNSFQLNKVIYYAPDDVQWYLLKYSGKNKLGGVTESGILFKMKNGKLEDYLDGNANNFVRDKNSNLYVSLADGWEGEKLDYRFIEYNME